MVRIDLYHLIESRGWTQRRLAQETGIREATVSDMCNNVSKMISLRHLDSICKALDCSLEDIVRYIPDNDIKKIKI